MGACPGFCLDRQDHRGEPSEKDTETNVVTQATNPWSTTVEKTMSTTEALRIQLDTLQTELYALQAENKEVP